MDLLQTVRKEGSRGGRADFKWEDVKADSQRENYLGHSLMAPVGRWQKGRDLNWYAKGDDPDQQSAADKLAEEKRRVKEAEEDAMLAAMGLPVPMRVSNNANLTPLGEKASEADVKRAVAGDRDDDQKRRKRSRSRSRERRDRRRDRSRSRERRKDRDHDRHRHRFRSHDRRRHDERRPRHRDRYSDDERSRSRSGDRHHRRRSRSPYDRHERSRRE
ncbi:hypothetical protein K469DRAFT_581761 [Zopfia rhizophila CBS 207.26]|uniref:Multiple myeloma tumor-associated protein 2-like N-terminal domain-containing protein n=1 Tax=Zopfia rhizophila CBS 207.26 TaxID=1314779 RepID=A0A6A6DVV1_9PEZI|nr:hypothetical protein K469DRAFT_581761 [Zopfia rhizophila CBS 207.26]